MYIKDQKIIIEILKERKDQLDNYFKTQCDDLFHGGCSNILEIKEILSPFQFLVKRGESIGLENENAMAFRNDNVKCLSEINGQGFGTVGLIAKDISTGVNYIVTGRHVLFPTSDRIQFTVDSNDGYLGHILCSDDGSIVCVAEKSYGVLECYGNKKSLVDISIIPVNTFESRTQCNEVTTPQLLNEYEIPLPQQEQEIYEVESEGVIIHGKGEIELFNARKNVFGRMCTDCLLIKPNQRLMQFSQKGDSGALVTGFIEGKEYCYGLICMGGSQSEDGAIRTIAVNLDNCFAAIKDHFGIDLKLCCRWNSCQISRLLD